MQHDSLVDIEASSDKMGTLDLLVVVTIVSNGLQICRCDSVSPELSDNDERLSSLVSVAT